MHPDSEQVVQEEHPIRVVVSEAPRPTITYSRTVSTYATYPSCSAMGITSEQSQKKSTLL